MKKNAMDFYRLYKIVNTYKIYGSLCALVLLVNLILQVTVIQNQQNEIHEQNKNYTALREDWNQKPDDPDVMKGYENRKMALEAFLGSLPEMAELSGKATEISSFFKKNNMTSGKIQFTPDRKDALSLWKYSTSLSVSGPYEGMKGLLADIHGSPSLFCIEHLSLKKGSEPDQVDMRLKISTCCR
jgi:Tfp pilus assembly protein PilO